MNHANHLTFEQIHSLLQGAAPPVERAALLEHVLECEDCAALLYERSAELPAAVPPVGMEERILEAVRKAPERRERKPETLRSYALRVFAAMAAALILLFSGAFKQLDRFTRSLPELSSNLRTQISEFFDFSDSTKEGLYFASEPK